MKILGTNLKLIIRSNSIHRIKYETIDFKPKVFFYNLEKAKSLNDYFKTIPNVDYKKQYETRDF